MPNPTLDQPDPRSLIDENQLAAELQRALQETIFTSTLRINPRRMNQLSQEMAASFQRFLELKNEQAVNLYGRQLAQEGLSPRSILALAEAVRRICWEAGAEDGSLLLPCGEYTMALLEAYIGAREAFVLQQQDQIHRAFERAQDRTM